MSITNFIHKSVKLLGGENLFFRTNYSCPKITLGNKNASFTVNPVVLSSSDIVYSFGIGTDISFDLELIKKFGVSVFAFDPTPKSIEWLRLQDLPETFRYFPIGLAPYSGVADFHLPKNENYVSASMTSIQSDKSIKVNVKTLSELMREFGHTSIDILKMDIEGIEYDVIVDILRSGIQIRQLLVEFHHRFHNMGSKITRTTIQNLKSAGFELFHVSGNSEEFSFINLKFSR